RSLSHSPLFQVMLVLQNVPQEQLELTGLKVSVEDTDSTIAKFDLTVSIAEHEDVLICDWEYRTDLFLPAFVKRMTEHFEVLLEGFINQPTQTVGQLPLLTEAEQQQLIAWNQTQTDYPVEKTIVDLFQEQVDKTPSNLAVVFEGQSLTYQELNFKANQLAHYLIEQGVQAETLVGICVERSIEMVIGLLGILKAGGAYVPLDPEYPAPRLQFMLEDSHIPILLTQTHLIEQLPASQAKLVGLDRDRATISAYSGSNPLPQTGPSNLAYVIYTSGSTGKPKGVMIEHKNLCHSTWTRQTYYQNTELKAFLLLSPVGFDSAVAGLFWSLTQGSMLVLPENARDLKSLTTQIWKHRISHLLCVPTLYSALLSQPDTDKLTGLKTAIIAGESGSQDILVQHHLKLPKTKLFNEYGPTEGTVWSSVSELNSSFLNAQCIGKPIANTQIYLLDAHHNPTPIGIPGELCLAGKGLARGYLNRPELTLSKFIEVNLFGEPKRLYKTGDLARWRKDGNLEYLGRLDHQVKLRGFRIELGEIETTLTQHETVREAVVVLIKDDGNPRLAAYVTLTTPTDDTASVLRTWLKARLPDYLIPAHIMVLEQLPLTPNGKIDRNALPAPDLAPPPEVLKEPQSEVEHLLSQIWSEVLGYDITNTNTDFFEAGGHSLLATQLVSRIRERFAVEMPLKTVFEHARLQEQADWLAHQQRGTRLPPLTPLAEGEPLVLSFAQLRLWFLAQLEGPSATYNMPTALRLSGELSVQALQQTFVNLIEHHLNLRLCFPEVDGQATVQVLAVYNPLRLIDLSTLPLPQQQHVANHLIAASAMAPFDLSTGPLMRVLLLKLKAHEHLLLFNMHHIISDGWSISVLVRQWSEWYEASIQNLTLPLPARSIQYPDYAVWQRNWLQGELLERQLTYWKEQLAGAPALLELPTDYPRPAVMTYQGAQLQTCLTSELTQRLNSFSQQNGVTLYMALLAAFQILLSRYTGQPDILVGTPIANRTHLHTEDLIGFFVNTLVLRTPVNSKLPGTELLKEVRQTALQAYAHQDIPFEYVVEQLNPARSLSHSPLFQVMLVLQNVPQEQLELSGLKISFEDTKSTIAQFDLTLSIAELEDVLVCDWEYRTDLFHFDTIKRMTEHFEVLLEGLINQPAQPVGQLPLLTEAEQQQLLAWNQTQTDYPLDKTIVDLFQEQVDKTPYNLAVVFEGQSLTYQALNLKANQLAHYLIEQGVQPETLVGICVERSIKMVIGLLGIMKAGGAYVPLDPDYPVPRLQFMLEDSQVPVLLTQTHLIERLPLSAAKLVSLDHDWATIAAYSSSNPVRRRSPENLAYVIYTSGSTGKPKGVMIEHRALANLLNDMQHRVRLTSNDQLLALTTLSFDIAALELYLPLLAGSQTIIISRETANNGETLVQKLVETQITLMQATPATWKLLLQSGWHQLTPLTILCGGEALPTQLGQTLLLNSQQLWNVYGPTETTIWSTTHNITQQQEQPGLIGRPISNTQIYILDAHHNPTPIGIQGELCIAGRGLARGYKGRPELTLEKFIEVEIFGEPTRIYKTGDLARWRSDGNLEYLGRLDYQIKLRGFRIELGEIEATLSQHEAVTEAVVVLIKDEGNPRLAAYVTLATPRDDTVSVLRTWLKARLPEYMLPASFTVLDKLPLTPNGKIDRNALPAPEAWTKGKHYLAPRDTVELQLAQIWEQVLERRPIGILENFFELGGHSLLAVRLMSQIHHAFDKQLPIATLFQGATIVELAQLIRHHEAPTTWPTLIPIQPQGSRPPLFCFPGAGGNVLYLHSLAVHLDKDQPCYGLQPPGLDGKSRTPSSIEALAAHHKKELIKVQPQGPYFLAGHSFGGQVAFELARQLEQQGETVALLTILDTSAPSADQEDMTATWDEIDWLWTMVEVFEELSEAKLDLKKETVQSQTTLAQSYELVMQHLKQGLFFAPTAESNQLKAIVDIYKANTHAQTHYQPQGPIKAPIVLFRAEEQFGDTPSVHSEDLDWSQYTEGEVIVKWVPGTHLTMLNAPHVKTLAAQLQTQLLLSTRTIDDR
ncbi:MAG TPA: non-ribosomal peptide synthetase, partial [Thioploca sp.]|nr:non-ribosomal peptide synthetase [Thioploca sp.]